MTFFDGYIDCHISGYIDGHIDGYIDGLIVDHTGDHVDGYIKGLIGGYVVDHVLWSFEKRLQSPVIVLLTGGRIGRTYSSDLEWHCTSAPLFSKKSSVTGLCTSAQQKSRQDPALEVLHLWCQIFSVSEISLPFS
jgi:hypothetical protein